MERDAKKMSMREHFEKRDTEECFITYDKEIRFVPSDLVCFGKLSRCD